MTEKYDLVVIGGGLGGMAAAFKSKGSRRKIALLDDSLPAAGGRLGGFAKFSGAKFSLLPAGQGLIPVAGSAATLKCAIDEVVDFLSLPRDQLKISSEITPDATLSSGLQLRTYESIVLSPRQIDDLVDQLTQRLEGVTIIPARVAALNHYDGVWTVSSAGKVLASAPLVIFAGGRTADVLLSQAGAMPQEGKGLDLGVRIEFIEKEALSGLRSHGPDAKILHGQCRTFCLNSPGEIYRYPFRQFSIPGGVVAEPEHSAANVGLLYRTKDKANALAMVAERLADLDQQDYESAKVITGQPLQDKAELVREIFGQPVASSLNEFATLLGDAGLVDWNRSHRIHFPLLDWHWDVYATGATHRTTAPGLYVIGDSAGHARGLLQAAVSGWLAAEEVARDVVV